MIASPSAFAGLDPAGRLLHSLHFLLCLIALGVAAVPLLAEKGGKHHKLGGMIYMPVSFAALLLASFLAWREGSLILFCFNSFCCYLLLSGWRAVHEKEQPEPIDWMIPAVLFIIGAAVAFEAVIHDAGRRSFYLIFFALNAFYLSVRDWQHLRRRVRWKRHKIFFAENASLAPGQTSAWLGRHVSGMIGSVAANLSVVILTLLPLGLHWLWPTVLIAVSGVIAWNQRQKKRRLRETLAPVMQGKFK